MFRLINYLAFIFLFLLVGCNKNLTDEEKEALWDKAQTEGEIVRRSGTPFNLSTDRELALRDAENRLRTGGGMLGKKNNLTFGGDKEESSGGIATVGMPINPYLWKASIDTLEFMPFTSADPLLVL